MTKKNKRTMRLRVTAQTASHLDRLAHEAGHNDPGRIVDDMCRSWLRAHRILGNALAILQNGGGS